MVDVLKACTQNHAPLSQGQTVKVFQYLEDLNKDTMRQIQDLKRSFEMSTSGIGDSEQDMKTMRAQILASQEELVKTNTRMSALRVDILGNAANVVVLQEQTSKANENMSQLREGQKVTNTNVHNLREEHLIAKEEIRKLQKEVVSLKEAKENILQAKLDHVLLNLQQCKEDVECNKMRTFENQDSCRNLREALSEAKANIGHLDKAYTDTEKRVGELTFKSDKTKDNLELTNGVIMRLHTEHEETRGKTIANMNKNHELDVSLRRLSQDDHAHLAQSVRIINEELSKLAAGQETFRDRLMETMERVGGLGSGTVNLQNTVHEMGKNLEWVHSLASNTQDSLKITNSMVLPNLGADGALGPSSMSCTASTFAAAKSMNSTGGTDGGRSRTSPRKSPRRRKDAAWFSRNIGAVPDRMAWI